MPYFVLSAIDPVFTREAYTSVSEEQDSVKPRSNVLVATGMQQREWVRRTLRGRFYMIS